MNLLRLLGNFVFFLLIIVSAILFVTDIPPHDVQFDVIDVDLTPLVGPLEKNREGGVIF
jgi:hypothetical protein